MGKLTLNESEKTKIKQLHGLNGVDLIKEQMDAEIDKIKCRKKYGKLSEKLTKKGYTKAEEGEEYEKGYKTKTIPNKECEDELWVKAKKEGNIITRGVDKYADRKVGKKEDAELNNLNSDIIGDIVGRAIGTSGGNDVVNMIDSNSWIVKVDGGGTDYFQTALNAINGMLQLGATVETLNNWMMSDKKNCSGREVNTGSVHDVVNDKYILASPRKALVSLDRITRGLTIRNKEIKELKTIVKMFKNEATTFWNAVEKGLGGNDDVITKQFADKKIRNIKDMFRRNMSAIATRTNSIVEMVNGQLTDGEGACSTAMTKTSSDTSKDY